MTVSRPIASSSSRDAPRTGRIILDLTDMVRFAHSDEPPSGVPRVALTLSLHAYRLAPYEVSIGYFDAITKTYCLLHNPELLADIEHLRSHLRRHTAFIRPLKPWKHSRDTARFRFHQLRRCAATAWHRLKSILSFRKTTDEICCFTPADQLVCLGGSWNSLDLFNHLRSDAVTALERPRIVALVHDLIPVLAPVPQAGDDGHFLHWLNELAHMKAAFLFYSKSSEADTRNLFRKRQTAPIATRRFRLADEFVTSGTNAMRDEVKRLRDKAFMLCVGSMNGRKNGVNLLKALKILRLRRSNQAFPTLVFAGSSTQDDLRRLHFHDAEIPEILFIPRPNDAELGFLYRHCRFTVFPSLYEGWGLPIGESLWHNKVCATSKVSSMPEVGGEDCDYFDPSDPASIARTLEPLIFDKAYLARRTSSIDSNRLWTWQESAENLLDVLAGRETNRGERISAPPPLHQLDRNRRATPAA